MIALDTNILVQYLTQEDFHQAELARELLESLTADQPGFICREVAIETVWVLERVYRFTRYQIFEALEELTGSAEIVIESHDDVMESAAIYRQGGVGFADLMIVAAARRADALPVYTFDRRLSRMDGARQLDT